MFISKTAVLLVVAVAATTSVVGGASTTNRKLSKNSPPPPPMTKCPSATLYYYVPFDNTIGSKYQHIFEVFRPPAPLGDQPRLCAPSDSFCIGDTVVYSNTLYSDSGLTNRVGKLAGNTKVVAIEDDGTAAGSYTASIVYDTGSEINVAGYFDETFRYQDVSVSGGTGDCAFVRGTVTIHQEEVNAGIGTFDFNVRD